MLLIIKGNSNIPFNSKHPYVEFTFRFDEGYYEILSDLEFGWHHFVIVLPGPAWKNKISFYHNGNKVENIDRHSRSYSTTQPSGSGKGGGVVIGRRYTDRDEKFTDANFDELIFWNRPLTDDEAKSIFESYNSNAN